MTIDGNIFMWYNFNERALNKEFMLFVILQEWNWLTDIILETLVHFHKVHVDMCA